MLADKTLNAHTETPSFEDDGIEAEMALLQTLLDQAADLDRSALVGVDLLDGELPPAGGRERYRAAGPAMVKVAAIGLATFPAALAPVPAFANEPLPQNMMLAMASRPESPPALAATGAQLFPFSRPMMSLRAEVSPVEGAKPLAPSSAKSFQLNPKLKTIFKESRAVAVTTKRGAASTFYQVGRGDSLYSIAADLLGSGARWREIASANKGAIGANYLLKPGQRLVIPTNRHVAPVHTAVAHKAMPANSPVAGKGGRYRVTPGDSLYTIAAKRLGNGERWREIVAMNKAALQGRTLIYPNQWLVLPQHAG